MSQRDESTLPRAAGAEGAPALDRLLSSLRARIARQVLLHGVGTVLVVTVGWAAFAFVADWGLSVPGPVRVLHSLVAVALPLAFVWRDLVRPWRRIPDRAGLAVLIERNHPELAQLLVSATEFRGRPASGDPELVRRVIAAAEARAGALDASEVVDPRGPWTRFGLGLAALASGAAVLVAAPTYASIFLDRMLGGVTPWPQRTHLSIEIPITGDRAGIEKDAREIHVRVARGTDVPVLVLADGVVPDEVVLHFEDGHEAVLPSGNGNGFRTSLRSLQEDVAFRATGGDDTDGEPRVSIEVLQPPDVRALAIEIEPPAYSDRPARVEVDSDVEVLAGSRVTVHALPDPPDATGSAALLPSGETVAMETGEFPPVPVAEREADPSADGPVEPLRSLTFTVEANESMRYRIDLVDSRGLRNPEPGLFAIDVVRDSPPELLVLAPGRSDVETVLGGAIALRARVEDDFGVESVGWTARASGETGEPDIEEPLPTRPLPPSESGDAPDPSLALLAGTRIDVERLGTEASPMQEGRQVELAIHATDNRRPTAGVGRSAPIRVRVISLDEMLRRVQDRLGRARTQASALADLQREKHERVLELIDSLASDHPVEGGDVRALQAALTGQRRVEGDASALARELASITESVLYARIDEKAGALLEFIDPRLAELGDRDFHPEVWRELTRAQAAGQLSAPGFAGKLVEILELSLAIREDHAAEATRSLDAALAAVDLERLREGLEGAARAQTTTLQHVEDLLERLAEWDNFQSVLALARDIRNRQKALLERTKSNAADR